MHPTSPPKAGTVGGFRAWAVGLLVALIGTGATSAALGQNVGDPPGRVARLSDAAGTVWLYSPERNDWLAIGRNQPLTSGDRIAVDEGARAEIMLGSTTLWLDAATELQIERLDDRFYRIRLLVGSVAAVLRSPQALAEFALVTDEGRFAAASVGLFRVDRVDRVDRGDAASDLTVYRGQATFESADSALVLGAGQHARFWLDAAGAAQYRTAAPVSDAFAAWSEQRDRADAQMPAVRYVSPEMTGAADLERYGNWEQSVEYGPVWYPRGVAADWAPYSSGHWGYVRPWGWTWVDAAPWGFAPFHYGRWVHWRDAWGWVPGRYVARPVYAPALVAWVGGAGFGTTLATGGARPPVGWFALAPHEVYVPSYRTSPIYLRNINFTHVPDPTRIDRIVAGRDGAFEGRHFSNRKFPHATTFVPANVLAEHQPVGPASARFRAEAQGRALSAGTQPAGVMRSAPVASPATGGPVEGRRPLRPPFEGAAGAPRRGRDFPPAVVGAQPSPAIPPQPELPQGRSRQPMQPMQPIEPVRPMRTNPIRPLAPVAPQGANPIQPIQPVQPLEPAQPRGGPRGAYEPTPERGFRGRPREPEEARGPRLPPAARERTPSVVAPRDIGERRFNRPDAPARMHSQDDRGNRERQR